MWYPIPLTFSGSRSFERCVEYGVWLGLDVACYCRTCVVNFDLLQSLIYHFILFLPNLFLFSLSVALLQIDGVVTTVLAKTCTISTAIFAGTGLLSSATYLFCRRQLSNRQNREKWKKVRNRMISNFRKLLCVFNMQLQASEGPNGLTTAVFWTCLALPLTTLIWWVAFILAFPTG